MLADPIGDHVGCTGNHKLPRALNLSRSTKERVGRKKQSRLLMDRFHQPRRSPPIMLRHVVSDGLKLDQIASGPNELHKISLGVVFVENPGNVGFRREIPLICIRKASLNTGYPPLLPLQRPAMGQSVLNDGAARSLALRRKTLQTAIQILGKFDAASHEGNLSHSPTLANMPFTPSPPPSREWRACGSAPSDSR